MHMRVKKKRHRKGPLLTLPVPCISESYIEVKIKFFFSQFIFRLFSQFIFTLLRGASKVFMKAFKAFIKPLEAPQRSKKIKI